MDMMQYRHLRIKQALENKRRADERVKSVVERIQSKCDHHLVAETPYKFMEYVDSMNPRRICLCCGYEEEGTIHSGGNLWSEKSYDSPVLGNTDDRIVTVVTRDEFYKLRV